MTITSCRGRSAYASTDLLSGTKRFVLGASGHIAGVDQPAGQEKRHYWTNNQVIPKPGPGSECRATTR